MSQSTRLFAGHEDILDGFNAFIDPCLGIGKHAGGLLMHIPGGYEDVVPSARTHCSVYGEQLATARLVMSRADMNNGAPKKLSVPDALHLLDMIKLRFSYQPQMYRNVLDIMRDFKSGE